MNAQPLPVICNCSLSRRRFIAGCAGCAALGGSILATPLARGFSPSARKPKVRIIFCQPKNDRPTWPNIGYDYAVREQQLLDLLAKRCPDIELHPARLIDQTAQDSGVLGADAEVDGYIVCLLGLGWEYKFDELCATGKPTLLVDNPFGGTGLFLTRLGAVLGKGQPVDWISSTNDEDLAAATGCFRLLAEGRSAADVVAAFKSERRRRTPTPSGQAVQADPVRVADMNEALKRLSETRILVVGGGWGGQAFAAAAKEVTGVAFIPMAFEELDAEYERADAIQSAAFADRWTSRAQAVVEPSEEDIRGSGAMYEAMRAVMKRHAASGITINCLGGFYGKQLKAYPCLGFSQFNNEGLVGGCEGDQMSALTMAVMGALVERPGYISDPVIDTSRNRIIYAHCVSMTKPFGKDGDEAPYRIRNHSEDRQGAAIQSLLPSGYLTTTLEINPQTREVLFHQARSAGNNSSDMACRTKLEGEVYGDIEKLAQNWRMGWHRVTFYGDLREPVAELCDRLQLRLVEEA